MRPFLRQPDALGHMPRDGLSLAVRVGGQVYLVSLCRGLFQLGHHACFGLGYYIGWLKAVLDIHAKLVWG